MKVNFPKEDTGFQIHPHQFCGLDSFLVIPKINAVWTTENLFFRSLIIDKSGVVLSSGWPKFFNNGEKPELYPDLHNYQDWHIHEKLDGSLLIADYVNGEFSMRTRGCSSYKQQSNFKDFELLHEKYPKIVDFLKENSHISLLCEIITPNNIIVIRTNDVQFYLLGAINKITLQVVSHQELLEIWKKVGCMPTPKSYQIDGIKDISTLANLVKQWKGSEGVVV
jgi:hypothetical protein